MPPTSDEQIRFLVNLQRLLDEGLFVASYKFALLLSLADIAIEQGDDSGAALTVSTDAIAEKFIRYYWRQVLPYPAMSEARVVQQNAGNQAAVVNAIHDARAKYGDSLASLIRNKSAWNQLIRMVAGVVRVMPLWKLQTVGRELLDFLYANTVRGRTIELRPGVAFCFRKFHPLISDLVRGAWARYVRQRNLSILGETTDLTEFLFGRRAGCSGGGAPCATRYSGWPLLLLQRSSESDSHTRGSLRRVGAIPGGPGPQFCARR